MSMVKMKWWKEKQEKSWQDRLATIRCFGKVLKNQFEKKKKGLLFSNK